MGNNSKIYHTGGNSPNSNRSRHASIKPNSFLDPQGLERSSKTKAYFFKVLVIPVSNNLSLNNINTFKVKNSCKALQCVKLHLI